MTKHHEHHQIKQLKGPPHGSEGIVGVHDGVDTVVHHHEPPPSGGEHAVRVKPVAHHGQVVIPASCN